MKNFLTLLATVLCLVANSQNLETVKTYYDPFSKTLINEVYTVLAGTPTKHGLYKAYDQKGILVKEVNYSNGKTEGLYKEYYSSTYDFDSRGKIGLIETYKNGLRHGTSEEYEYPQGKKWLKATEIYSNGELVKSITYYPDGKQKEVKEPGGADLIYSPNGIKLEENNHKSGIYNSWFENGKLQNTGHYTGNQKTGTWKSYDENGRLRAVRVREDDGTLALLNLYDESGRLTDSTKRISANNYLEFVFDSTGTHEETECKLENPKEDFDPYKDGKTSEYYSSGKIRASGSFKKNELDGAFVVYYENGKPQVKGAYRRGLQFGRWEYFTESGELESTTTYDAEGNEMTAEEVTHQEIKDLFRKKGDNLNPQELEDVSRVIRTMDTKNYARVLNLLKAK
jgi:antitoxin component YwqK of YwqJK toxin-antitoxin module